jgi:hypothetical protein
MPLGIERAGTRDQRIFGFGNVWIGHTAIYRACRGAFLMVKEPDTLGAFVGRNVIDILCQRQAHFTVQFGGRAAFVDCIVWASRQTSTAIDTFFGDNSRHLLLTHQRSWPDFPKGQATKNRPTRRGFLLKVP